MTTLTFLKQAGRQECRPAGPVGSKGRPKNSLNWKITLSSKLTVFASDVCTSLHSRPHAKDELIRPDIKKRETSEMQNKHFKY